MTARQLTGPELARLLADCPDELCDLVLELRDLVCEVAEDAAESIKFHALCYAKLGQSYGVIGGNVCMIEWRADHVRLAFIQGVFLPDPDSLLQGTAEAKRYVEIRTSADIARPGVAQLIRAAVYYSPGTEDE
jgi:hypothetical protein